MPHVYISGKPVLWETKEELDALLPLADSSVPRREAPATSPDPRPAVRSLPQPAPLVPAPSRPTRRDEFRGAFAGEDDKTQRFLRTLATYGSKPASGDELKAALGLSPRDLAGIGGRISKLFGKGSVIKVSIERRGKQRLYQYRLSSSALTIAKEEGWG